MSEGKSQARQAWDAERYERDIGYVSKHGMPVVELLAPAAGEHILDIGCGDGTLMQVITETGATVAGIDADPSMIGLARDKGLDAEVCAAEDLDAENRFDALFSNATLHWVGNIGQALAAGCRALKPGGRFVGEFGGKGNVNAIVQAMEAEFAAHPEYGEFVNPWYYPSPEDFSAELARAGFEVVSAELIPRPTLLTTGIEAWLDVFTASITQALDADTRKRFILAVRDRLAGELQGEDGAWTADYVRLRFVAVKPDTTPSTRARE
ncbi:MAG: SAM-dependent methyltransferase [Gammaproteobacteria bacterium]|nr:MAG: SAM-dependent methyltransferase [Gammaproteobacteria bacterium]